MKSIGFSWLLFITIIFPLSACQVQSSTALPISPAASLTTTPMQFDELEQQFDYDSTAPLNIQSLGKPDFKKLQIMSLPQGIRLSEVAYDAPGGMVKGYLVEPEGKGPFAGVLWVHKYPGT